MVWLVGHKGMLGSEVRAELDRRGLPHLDTDREVDISDEAAVRVFLQEQSDKPAWIVNCAAYAAVDRAEDDAATAQRVNATGVAVLADAARRTGAAIVHLSTDYVFDGAKQGAYTEEDPPAPIGVYGSTKLAGEEELRARCARHYIVRTSWLFGKGGANFVATMLRLFWERDEVGVVADQWGRPTYAVDLACALVDALSSGRDAWGTYHFANQGRTSWFGFAEAVLSAARERGLVRRDVRLSAITTPEYPTRARRPANSELSTGKIESAFGLRMPDWRDALDRYLHEIEPGATR